MLVTPDFFDRKVSSCFIQGRKPAQTFNPTWYSRGWRGSGLPDLFAVGTSAGGISPTYQVTYLLGGRMKVHHLMSIRPMECWLATLNASSPIMSHALEQINAARIGVICISASSKLSVSCLHGYSVSIQKIQGFFWKAIFAIPPIVPAVTIHTLPWKMRVETCPLFFQYGILPGSFPFRAWCGDFQFRGCISTKTLSSKRGLLTGTSWNWRVCPLHAWQ